MMLKIAIMRKLYENFYIFHFQKRIVSAETIRGNMVFEIECDESCNIIWLFLLLELDNVENSLLSIFFSGKLQFIHDDKH